jgi:hypothetical protein
VPNDKPKYASRFELQKVLHWDVTENVGPCLRDHFVFGEPFSHGPPIYNNTPMRTEVLVMSLWVTSLVLKKPDLTYTTLPIYYISRDFVGPKRIQNWLSHWSPHVFYSSETIFGENIEHHGLDGIYVSLMCLHAKLSPLVQHYIYILRCKAWGFVASRLSHMLWMKRL